MIVPKSIKVNKEHVNILLRESKELGIHPYSLCRKMFFEYLEHFGYINAGDLKAPSKGLSTDKYHHRLYMDTIDEENFSFNICGKRNTETLCFISDFSGKSLGELFKQAVIYNYKLDYSTPETTSNLVEDINHKIFSREIYKKIKTYLYKNFANLRCNRCRKATYYDVFFYLMDNDVTRDEVGSLFGITTVRVGQIRRKCGRRALWALSESSTRLEKDVIEELLNI